jgi:hypothetical protein
MNRIKWVSLAMLSLAGCLDAGSQANDDTSEDVQLSSGDCEGGANGFIDISDSLSGTVQRSVNMGFGVTVTLQSGTVAGAQRGWAKIGGSTLSGDLVWMDFTKNNWASWIQCGPFAVGSDNHTKTSAAQRTSSSTAWQFRACGNLAGIGDSICTSPW